MSIRLKAPALLLLALVAGAALAGCDGKRDVAAPPPPQEPGVEAVAYFCGMAVADSPGPKGQIFLAGQSRPLWFMSVRDTLAYTMLPEESKAVAAIYVNDMARARNWEHPEPGAWVAARDAVYVVGSSARGGMGAAEAVPFSDWAAAERFRAERGGTIYGFAEIPQDYVLGEGGRDGQTAERAGPDAAAKEDDHASH
ncbi:copper chaperone NosL [Tistlia consotensis]|uniref:Copper chaperone NosL n=1 Tax=Tistlia consotensis USBA 355 TaxID=560819 RepID=A0A1Y6BPA8_9PROT|nr:nitrous oxide reductase accessory protein NosL [Tistlia consotensis]SMF21585.1 copper chaperone NosL [Tistlia consotensis USBA 355]SNR46773.1 copper chaperone NosL [Tistlia consotensis]